MSSDPFTKFVKSEWLERGWGSYCGFRRLAVSPAAKVVEFWFRGRMFDFGRVLQSLGSLLRGSLPDRSTFFVSTGAFTIRFTFLQLLPFGWLSIHVWITISQASCPLRFRFLLQRIVLGSGSIISPFNGFLLAFPIAWNIGLFIFLTFPFLYRKWFPFIGRVCTIVNGVRIPQRRPERGNLMR